MFESDESEPTTQRLLLGDQENLLEYVTNITREMVPLFAPLYAEVEELEAIAAMTGDELLSAKCDYIRGNYDRMLRLATSIDSKRSEQIVQTTAADRLLNRTPGQTFGTAPVPGGSPINIFSGVPGANGIEKKVKKRVGFLGRLK